MVRRKCLLSAVALIAFMLVGAVFASPTMTQLTHITASSYHPSISGDGKKIAFQSYDGYDTEIFVINSDGTGLTQLTHNTVEDSMFSISRNGTKIAYQSNVDGDFEIFLWEEENGIDGGDGADSGLNITTIAIIATIVVVSVTAALYLIIRGRRSKQTEKRTTRGR